MNQYNIATAFLADLVPFASSFVTFAGRAGRHLRIARPA